MGSRFLTFVAFLSLGLTLMKGVFRYGAELRQLYVSPRGVPVGYRAVAGTQRDRGFSTAALMAEMSPEEIAKRAWLAKLDTPSWGPNRVATSGAVGTEVPVDLSRQADYDWRMNQKDWRFRYLSMIPLGLLFIAASLQRTKRAELARAEKFEPLPKPAIAMVSVRGQGQQSRSSRPRQTLEEWICM
jgi:hypothetical protein